jgi:hypothetical protein
VRVNVLVLLRNSTFAGMYIMFRESTILGKYSIHSVEESLHVGVNTHC